MNMIMSIIFSLLIESSSGLLNSLSKNLAAINARVICRHVHWGISYDIANFTEKHTLMSYLLAQKIKLIINAKLPAFPGPVLDVFSNQLNTFLLAFQKIIE